tara:strand:+ start:291 stop:1421 length:1131 start_codon:yes stop_codon:yes gene_type:complete
MMERIIQPRRRLGTGHYDRKLIERMTELSVADNYEDAQKEWMATGNVYWGDDEIPDWWESPKQCLCGHRIEYHFEVENIENGNMILVGSDHINSYHILKQISMTAGIDETLVTDEMIDEWLKIRVASMMQTAWWHKNGELFTKMFDAIKEYDVRLNVKVKKWAFNSEYQKPMPITVIRKGSSGSPATSRYKMASIVWRWNHPDNPKNQQTTRGYPTEKLWTDLIMFYARIEEFRSKCDDEDRKNAHRLKNVKRHKLMRDITVLMLAEEREKMQEEIFLDNCEYYGIPDFSKDIQNESFSRWERTFLQDLHHKMQIPLFEISSSQLKKLKEIYEDTPATDKQKKFLLDLGYAFTVDELSKRRASELIEELKTQGFNR